MDATRPVSSDLSHYLGMLRRHWWVLLLLTAAGLIAATLLTQAQPKVYQSSTSVLVQPAGQDTNVVGGRTKGDINLDTEAQLVRSTAVAAGAAALLRSTTAPDDLARGVKVDVPANTSVLVVTYESNGPAAAQAGSHAFAEAYLRNREESARADLDRQIGVLAAKIKQLNTTLTDVNNRLPRSAPDSAQRANLESQRNNSLNQLNGLTSKLNELSTATVGAGKIISDARVPDSPSSPNTALNLATGAMVGILLGLGLAAVRERLDRRIRTANDVRQRARITVLAALDERTVPRFDDVLQPYGPGGRVFNRLRNEVLASLRPEDQIIVVTGVSRGPATTLVAANLASALARTGGEVALIGAHLPDSVVDAAPLARIFGIRPTPGLSELLAGRVGLAEASQRAPRIPSLRVITTGGAATAGGLMQSRGLRETLEVMRRQVRYIVIEAPSTASSADAQSLASLADAAILAVELRRARRPDLLDAAEQLRRVATPLLGAVVLPRLASIRASDAMAPIRPAVAPSSETAEDGQRRPEIDADRTQLVPADRAQTPAAEHPEHDNDRTQTMHTGGLHGVTTVVPPRTGGVRRPGPGGSANGNPPGGRSGYGGDEDTAIIDLASLSALDLSNGRLGAGDNRAGESDGLGR
jgi:capsular polysaccharide biosynthesis protein/MinD-like ATPase involved in chromosome partitioning or flagellar assembly